MWPFDDPDYEAIKAKYKAMEGKHVYEVRLPDSDVDEVLCYTSRLDTAVEYARTETLNGEVWRATHQWTHLVNRIHLCSRRLDGTMEWLVEKEDFDG